MPFGAGQSGGDILTCRYQEITYLHIEYLQCICCTTVAKVAPSL